MHAILTVLSGRDLWEKKNAALCFGNLCCDWSLTPSLVAFLVPMLFVSCNRLRSLTESRVHAMAQLDKRDVVCDNSAPGCCVCKCMTHYIIHFSLHNQTIVGSLSRNGMSTISGLVEIVLHSPDENSKIFATLALNNLACFMVCCQPIAFASWCTVLAQIVEISS